MDAKTTLAPATGQDAETVISVENLRISFRTDEGLITPVDGVSFSAKRGKTLGIVGESGSGKSVSTRALMKLLPRNAVIDPASRILLRTGRSEPVDITVLHPDSREMRKIRGGSIAMIFQEPMASFSPVYTIGNQIVEAVRLHRQSANSPLAATETVGEQIEENLLGHSKLTKKHAHEIAVEMLHRVGMSNARLRVNQFPHELSGGMRQRAMIAVALSTQPALLIADEPTTALDVTIQAQILELMKELQDDLGMSIIFITHDMGVIAQVADEVAVMYLGKIVERGPTRQVIAHPHHPYTQGLLRAIPRMDNLSRRLTPVAGDIPSPLERPKGCPFVTRCPERMAQCATVMPGDTDLGNDQSVACFLHG
jgi:peptide/nickel transport system ATP-binding protein